MTGRKDRGQHERSLETVRRWYHNHAPEYNEYRRQRYADDEDVREKAKERARDYRKRRRQGIPPESGPLYRFVNGKGPCPYGEGTKIPVFTTGHIASMIGSTPQMIRNWESKHWLPPCIFSDKHRLYTMAQVKLIVKLSNFMKDYYRLSPKKHKDSLLKLVAIIKKQWGTI